MSIQSLLVRACCLFLLLSSVSVTSSFAAEYCPGKPGSPTLSWSWTNGPTSCSAIGSGFCAFSVPGSLPGNGSDSKNITIPGGTSDFSCTATLSCGGGVQSSDTLTWSSGKVWDSAKGKCDVPVTPPPTASLTITAAGYGTNVHSIAYPAGTPNTKYWSSTNGSSYSDSVRRTGSCANNSWGNTSWSPWGVATTPSGNSSGSGNQGDVNCTVEISYTVNNASGNNTDQIDVTVTRCLDGYAWGGIGTGCVPCGNGGCTGTGGSPGSPNGGLSCINGGSNPPTCTPPVMSGTLSASPLSCTVSNGASTCNSSFTWTTTNPVATSQVVGDGGGPFSASRNNSTQSLAVRYINGFSQHIFRLYNNGSELDTVAVLADCQNTSAWNGSSCQACSNGGCGGPGSSGPHTCNNGAGDAPTCTPPACANGAIDPGTCTTCSATQVMYLGTCTSCSNGGCGTIAPPHQCNNGGSNPPTCTPPACANGAINAPACTTCPANQAMNGSGTCVPCSNGGCGTTAPPNQCNNGASDAPTCVGGTGTTGYLNVSSPSCIVPTGASTCTVNLTWDTTNPVGTSQITRTNSDLTTATEYTKNKSTAPGGDPVTLSGSYSSTNFFLYNVTKLAEQNVTVSCAAGAGKWNTTTGKCVDPQVVNVTVTGEFGPGGKIIITCSGSNGWVLLKDGNSFRSGAYSGVPEEVSVSEENTYQAICKNGNVASSQVAKLYRATPPPDPRLSLLASPKTIAKGGQTILTWSREFPVASCAITAKVVCANNSCDANQTKQQKELNDILGSNTERTDANDSYGSNRPLRDAIRTIAPGHEATDWKALGKRTLKNLLYTTDFTYQCSNGNKETQRVQVTVSNEG